MNSKNHNRINRWADSMIVRTLMAAALALTAISTSGMAQPCGYTPQSPPGKVYPLFDHKLGITDNGRLPLNVSYRMEEDNISMSVEDGTNAGVAPNQVRIVLNSIYDVTWRKEIVQWKGSAGPGAAVFTQDSNHGPTSMTLTLDDCAGGVDTIVFRKAKFFGLMFDMYHLEVGNFSRILRGKVVTFTWLSDTEIHNPYPMPCPMKCVPLGVTRRTTDIALTGPAGWTTLPVASSLGDGNFRVTNLPIGDFAIWASNPQAVKLTGDFDMDGLGDIALTGPAGWDTLPMAFSKGDGTFHETNAFIGDFATLASDPQAVKLTGDFDRIRGTDIALVGGAGWNMIHVAFSWGSRLGKFEVKSFPVGDFAILASNPQAVKLTGDFNGDGLTDIALTGVAGWNMLPVALSDGKLGFKVTYYPVGDFASWASHPQAVKLTGDFNGDGKTDIALTGPSNWNTLPVARSNGDGTFTVTNSPVGIFASWASQPQVAKLSGDFNGDGKTDIALTGGAGWNTLPVAISNGNGNFTVYNEFVGDFAGFASDPQSLKLIGDFNGDGLTDIALTGPGYWNTLPVAFSWRAGGTGKFKATNMLLEDFAFWSSYLYAAKVTRDIN